MEKQNNKLSGIIVPIITPFVGQDQLDIKGTEKLIEHIINGGVSGVFALGTTGEAVNMPIELKKEFVKLVCKCVGGRIPVFIGVTDTSFSNTISLAKYSCDYGARAAVLMAPYFYKLSQEDLLRYFKNLLPQIPLDVLMYNIPSCAKIPLAFETLRQLKDEQKIIGIKDSSGDIEYFKQIVKLKGSQSDWSVLCGPDKLVLESMKAGGDGGVNAGANILPGLFINIYNEFKAGNIQKADDLNVELMKLYKAAHVTVPYIACFKHILKCMGICESFISEPFGQIEEEAKRKIEEYLKKEKLV